MRLTRVFAAAAVIALGASTASAATITQLTGYGDLTPSVLLQNFEVSKDTAWVTFDATAFLCSAAACTSGVTPSGVQGLADSALNDPLIGTLAADAFEVGLTFGNDDSLEFSVALGVYNELDQLLGQVIVAANRNDFADQFIGLRSDVGFRKVAVLFARPAAGNLSVYIDDLAVGNQTPIPEPASLLFIGSGLAGLAMRRRRRSR